MITIENADKALKDYYLDAVTAQLNDGVSPFFSAIEKSAVNVYGTLKWRLYAERAGIFLRGRRTEICPTPIKTDTFRL